MFFEGRGFAKVSTEYVWRACKQLDIRPEWIVVLFLMFLITEATKYYKFLSQCTKHGYGIILKIKSA